LGLREFPDLWIRVIRPSVHDSGNLPDVKILLKTFKKPQEEFQH
jgi:hypothetical protein